MYLLASVNVGTCTSSSNGRRKSYDNVKERALSSNAAITNINYLQDLWKLHDKHFHWLHISCISSSKKERGRKLQGRDGGSCQELSSYKMAIMNFF